MVAALLDRSLGRLSSCRLGSSNVLLGLVVLLHVAPRAHVGAAALLDVSLRLRSSLHLALLSSTDVVVILAGGAPRAVLADAALLGVAGQSARLRPRRPCCSSRGMPRAQLAGASRDVVHGGVGGDEGGAEGEGGNEEFHSD